MVFRLEASGSLGSEIRRAAHGELDAALHELNASESPLEERVHETRKHIKKLRALLQLVRSRFGRDAFQRTDGALREVAHVLGPLREHAALGESLDALARDFSDDSAVAELRAQLLSESARPILNETQLLTSARAGLVPLFDELERLASKADTWDEIAVDFQRTYAAGRRAYRRAAECPNPERLHTLRRRAKRHQHHLALLEPIWPGPLEARREELSTLSDELGEHHDLALLEAVLQALTAPDSLSGARSRLASVAAERSLALQTSALQRAARLYAERPGRLRSRFGKYFGVWRRQVTVPS